MGCTWVYLMKRPDGHNKKYVKQGIIRRFPALHIFLMLFFFYKFVFSKSAYRAYPVIRKICKFGAGLDSVVRITHFGIIDISAGFTYIAFHDQYLLAYFHVLSKGKFPDSIQ